METISVQKQKAKAAAQAAKATTAQAAKAREGFADFLKNFKTVQKSVNRLTGEYYEQANKAGFTLPVSISELKAGFGRYCTALGKKQNASSFFAFVGTEEKSGYFFSKALVAFEVKC